MRVQVSNRSVKKNLEAFNFLLQKERKPEVSKKKNRTVFHVSVDRASGEIVFQDLLPSAQVLSNKEWKPVCLRLSESIGERKFELLEIGEGARPVTGNDLHPKALDILLLTLQALNELLVQARKTADPNLFLDQLIEFELQEGEVVVDTDILRSAWHPLSRAEAEKVLNGKIPGMFLFRKDEYASLLEKELRHPCVTLTYTDGKEKVVDCTLVHYENCWLVYNGNPNLERTPYKTVLALIASLGHQLSLPFFR